MAIIIDLDVVLAQRKMSVSELSEKVGITLANTEKQPCKGNPVFNVRQDLRSSGVPTW